MRKLYHLRSICRSKKASLRTWSRVCRLGWLGTFKERRSPNEKSLSRMYDTRGKKIIDLSQPSMARIMKKIGDSTCMQCKDSYEFAPRLDVYSHKHHCGHGLKCVGWVGIGYMMRFENQVCLVCMTQEAKKTLIFHAYGDRK